MRWARPIAGGAALLFLADLFLSWQRTDVRVTGAVHVHHMASGWSGWGVLAGLCAIALLGVVVAGRSSIGLFAALGTGLFVLTLVAVLTADATDGHRGVVAIEVDSTRWPAWVGLGLAAVAGAASALPLLAERRPRRA